MGSLGSRRAPAAEGRAGLLLAIADTAVGDEVAGWGALAGPMRAAAIAGDPFWVLQTG